ncbi:hypothetical protein KQX54_010398 [Cotesia glomerata]|uniref:Uncharacterized protein n=1 Tax=Cotesia glomerata TaxID=32391 RepID=A0AAV7I5A5_COTGL|nr:hypothetical protein KQX54_010398 [Cotesia glomerata]
MDLLLNSWNLDELYPIFIEKLSEPGSEFQDPDTKPTLGITDANFESSADSSSLHTDNASIVTTIDISDLPVISETDLQEPEQLLIVNSTSTSKRDSKLVNFDLRKILEDHPIGRALLRTAPNHIDERQTSSPLASKQWLVNNREDADVLIHWDLSYDLRREEVENKKYLSAIDIFNDWPILKETIGSKLIHIDFKKLYANKENSLIESWDNIFSLLVENFQDKLSEEHQRKLQYLRLSDHVTVISKSLIQLEILVALLAPKINKNKYKKVDTSRLSSLEFHHQEIKNTIYLHVKVPGDIQKAFDDKTFLMIQAKKTIQPFLIIVGQDELKLEKVYVQVDNVSLAYPIESENIWYFLQWGIYKITTNSDAQIPLVFSILNKLKLNTLPTKV